MDYNITKSLNFGNFKEKVTHKTYFKPFSRAFLVFCMVLVTSLLIILCVNNVSAVLLGSEYEYNNITENSQRTSNLANRFAQTFTVGTVGDNSTINATYIRLKIYRSGTPGILNVTIYTVNETHAPNVNGTVYASGFIDADTIATTPGAWYDINLTTYNLLQSNGEYAIVLSAPSAVGGGYVDWWVDTTGNYLGGQVWGSTTSGIVWSNTTFNADDAMFSLFGLSSFYNLVIYNSSTEESTEESFILNMTYNSTAWTSISTKLYYNNTYYSSSKTGSGDNVEFINTINMPIVGSTAIDKNFSFEVTLFNATGSETHYVGNFTQTINPILFGECAGGTITETLNFTAYDEATLQRINGWNFDGTFTYYIGDSLNKKTFNFSYENINEKVFCINTNIDFTINGIIQYNKNSTGGYVQRNYFFQNFQTNNITQKIKLLLLNETESTSFIIKLRDTNLLPLSEYLIRIQRYYPGTNSYETVQVIETDDNGQGVGFFKTETVDYRFIIEKDGVVYLTTTKQKIVPETSPYTITLTLTDILGSPWDSLEDLENLEYTASYNKIANKFTLTYSDTSSDFISGNLLVYQINATGLDRLVCNTTSTATNAVIDCDLTGEPIGTYYGLVYITRDIRYFIDSSVFEVENFSDVIGMFGVLMGFFIVIIAASAFFFNEIVGIWAVSLSIIVLNFINIVSFGWVFITGILAVALILTILFKR